MTDSKYQNGKIYKIVSDQTCDVYIGSSAQKYLSMRMRQHRDEYNIWKKDNSKRQYISSFELLKYDDARIILVENYPCNTKDELRAREEYHRKQYNEAINSYKAHQSHEEHLQYMRKWHEDNKEYVAERAKKYRAENRNELLQKKTEYYNKNKEQINGKRREQYKDKAIDLCQYQKQYREENKEKVKQRQNAKITCLDCGKEFTYSNKNVHLKSKYHLENSTKPNPPPQ